MASLRRNKTLSPDGQTARFLYTIIKQLDLKAIDWTLVAGSLEITNGHAARMRYSRFKQHMEGVTTQPRAPRTGAKKEKGGKEGGGGKRGKKRAFEEEEEDRLQKAQPTSYVKREMSGLADADVSIKREGGTRIKIEDNIDPAICIEDNIDPAMYDIQIKPEPGLEDNLNRAISPAPPAKRIKAEPNPDADTNLNPDIWCILPHPPAHPDLTLRDKTPRSTMTPSTQSPNPANSRLQASFPPHHAAATTTTTVSLADLEVSPRSIAADVSSDAKAGGAVGGFAAYRGFGNGVGSRRALECSTAEVQIKAEPGLERRCGAAVSMPGGAGEVVVKMEPVEL